MAKVFRHVPRRYLTRLRHRLQPLKITNSNQTAGAKTKDMSFTLTRYETPDADESKNRSVPVSLVPIYTQGTFAVRGLHSSRPETTKEHHMTFTAVYTDFTQVAGTLYTPKERSVASMNYTESMHKTITKMEC